MKFDFGIRSTVILLFLGIFVFSLLVLNGFFLKQQAQINKAFSQINIDSALAELSYQTEQDSLKAGELIREFRQSVLAAEMIRTETQIYSNLFLIIILISAIVLFCLIFYKITKPIKELQLATANIREGDYNVHLSEKGLKELRDLKKSFNDMSSELEHTQNKLLMAEKEMIWKELSRILAHEIKNPLTPIQLSVQRLEEKFYLDEEKFKIIFPEAVKVINQEVDNLRDLVHSFSNYAKIAKPEFSVFETSQALNQIIKPYLHDYNIKLEISDSFSIKFDQTHFYQIITNILQNAIDACEKSQPIEVSVEKSRSFVVIRITDHGSGISKEDLTRIFEPYFTKKKKGTGLGLALVKKLIDINNAVIRAKSIPGQGTVFEIIIEDNNECINN